MKNILLIVFLLVNYTTQAQEYIEAILKDSSTQKPLIYANVHLLRQNIGTITNSEGKFRLYIPLNAKSDSIELSFVSYKKRIIPLCELAHDSVNVIYLSPQDIYLSDVDIFGLKAEKVLRNVQKQVAKNYRNVPSTQKAYFREIIYQNGNIEKFSDANLLIRKEAYNNKKADKMQYLSGENYKNLRHSPMWDYIFFVNGTYESVHCDLIKYPHSFLLIPSNKHSFFDERRFKLYNYRIRFESDSFYVIEFSPYKKRAIYKGQLIVDKQSFALLFFYYYIAPSALDRVSLLRYDVENYLRDKNIQNRAIDYFAYGIYAKQDNKYSLQQAGLNYQSLFYSSELGFFSNLNVQDQIVISSIDTAFVVKIPIWKRISGQTSIHRQIAGLKNKNVDSLPLIEPENGLRNFMQLKK